MMAANYGNLPGGHEGLFGAAIGISDCVQLGVHSALGTPIRHPPPFFSRRLEAVRCAFRQIAPTMIAFSSECPI